MKQQKIKQLALLGLASGLLAATATAEAADKSSPAHALLMHVLSLLQGVDQADVVDRR